MANCYNLDGVKKSIEKDIDMYEALLSAWEKVTFPVKKDGKPFVNMSKNFKGATFKRKDYGLSGYETELKVHTNTKLFGYATDYVDCYCLVKYLKDEKKKLKTENYMPKEQYLEQVYKYDLEDIKEAVSNRIEQLKKNISSLKNQLNKADEVYNNFKKAYSLALKTLAKETNNEEELTLYYNVLDTVKNRYPYC